MPSNASEQRKAQAKQLKAYLLFLINCWPIALLNWRTLGIYFLLAMTSPSAILQLSLDDPGISDLWVEQNNDSPATLQQIFGTSVPGLTDPQQTADWQRKNRFLDHLLARFAEQFTDYSSFVDNSIKDEPKNKVSEIKINLLSSKLSFLRSYDQLSISKGSGFNVLAAPGADNRSGLEQILQLKLGVLEPEKLYVIEHALLRPMAGDTSQKAPLLTNALTQDPYSLQLTVVLFISDNRKTDIERFVEQTVRDETPAHIMVYVCFLDLVKADSFDAAYQDWHQKHLAYRTLDLNNQHVLNGPIGQSAAIPLRDARDRLIDWVGIGRTYPIRDLAVTDTTKVAYNIQAIIVISNSQRGVSYSLCDDRQKKLDPDGTDPDLTKDGNGGDLQLLSPAIVENRIFSIQAKKLSNGLTTMLLQNTTVIVGLDLNLAAGIQSGQQLLVSPRPATDDARLVDYGVKVTVAIYKTQEGVDYQLVRIDGKKETPLSDVVRGDNKTIFLVTTEDVIEDVDIRIRATKNFDQSENKNTETDLLTTVLPLKVSANPALSVSMLNPIVDYSGTASVKIHTTQSNVRYQALIRNIADKEFIHGTPTGDVISIPSDNKQTVVLSKPTINGFEETTLLVQGQGGDLELNLTKKLIEDSFVRIRAVKSHVAKNGETVNSTVDLAQVAAALVRPNPNPALRLMASINNSVLQAPIQVSGGQAGVFYEFTTLEDNKVQGLPVYFHQRDRDDNTLNKGIGQLQVSVDLVIAPSLSAERLTANPNIASLPPAPPELSDNVTLRNDAELSIRAFKAQSGVEVVFKRKVGDLLVESK